MSRKIRGFKVPKSELERAEAELKSIATLQLPRDEDGRAHVVGLSGGKDSTALALRMKELWPELPVTYLCTPTGDELPELEAHWQSLEELLGAPILRLTNRTLNEWIEGWNMLPSFHARWCTRVLKIVPAEVFARAHSPIIMYVGFRADEPDREGIYSPDIETRFPMRDEWGWKIDDVWRYLRDQNVKVPRRTDCARCFYQRVTEWKRLWRDHPDLYAEAEAQEASTGHTFRSPTANLGTWPVSLADLRSEFERGRIAPDETPRELGQLSLLGDDEDDAPQHCRVCTL